MFSAQFTGQIQDLLNIAHFCKLRGQWYFSEKHSTYVLSTTESKLTWRMASGAVGGIAHTLERTMLFYDVLTMFELQKVQKHPLPFLKPSKKVEILPLPTKHPLRHAYILLRAFNNRPGGTHPRPLVNGGVADSAATTAGASRLASTMIARVAKPTTPAQEKLCDAFSHHLNRAENASVGPETFEDWIGRDILNAWSKAAKQIGMYSENEGALHFHDFLSDEDNADISAYLARSALH